jgi:adenylylsulfate kinase
MKNKNLVWQQTNVSQKDRETLINQKSFVLWFTGLSGSGKSTIASQLEKNLHNNGYLTYVLDGDNIRHGLNSDLAFSSEDRHENIRRVAEMAKLMTEAGIIVIVSFISPFNELRHLAQNIIGKDNFIEIFVDTPLEICEKRDVKGLYKLARSGMINDFTGIDSPYEKPENPNIKLTTVDKSINENVEIIFRYLKSKNIIKRG